MDKNELIELYQSALRIRCVEERIAEKYSEQKMRCPTHLSIGQEVTPVSISSALTKDDLVVSTHRGHAHYLAKGGNLKAMIAEIYGKSTGCSKGKGGSMHLIDKSVGFMGTSAIVGNSIPIGVGLALSNQLKENNFLSVIYLGDGAIEEGVFYESLNFAIVRNLRVLFVCENNLYSVYSPLSVRQPAGREIFKMVKGFGIKSEVCDGNDIEESYRLSQDVAKQMREDGKPFFIEFKTYRHREHCGPNFDNDIGYRSSEEFELWKSKDPILNIQKILLEKNICDINNLCEIKKGIDLEVNEAFKFAEESNFPEKEAAFKDIYSTNFS